MMNIRAQIDTTANDGTVNAIMGVNILVRPRKAETGINSTTFA